MNLNQTNKHLIALTHFPKFGPVRLRKMKKYFSDWESAFNANVSDFKEAGIEDGVISEFLVARAEINPDGLMERLEKENIKTVTPDDNIYPKLLLDIYDPPQLLYYKGELIENDEFTLAVVGSRKFTSYGQRATEDLTRELASNGLTIVSGLAIGIDAIAHNAALEVKGRTIGVLGSGLDRESIYPTQNRYLADKVVASGGAVISEFPLGTQPLKFNFPQRNRIVAGMSLGTLVIEADEKSGALITSRFALENGREVFALPGNIYSAVSRGTNNLIKEGARVVTKAQDIMDAFNLKKIKTYIEVKSIVPENKTEALVLSYIKEEQRHINEIVRLSGLDISQINVTLTVMEMKGLVRNMGNGQYVSK